jgi:transposase
MSRKKHTHLRGERGQAFADKMRGIPVEQILCVSLDIHKYFHVVMMHNALGEIVTPPFEIDIFQAGFDRLCQAIDEAVGRTNAQVVLVGMEPTGHYFENLARHLHHGPRSPRPVTLINSFAVSRNREQQMMRREKDDEIDVAAIGDLLRRGEGTPFQPIDGLYLEMQHLSRVRLSKVKMQTALKNQILGHLDRIFPGLVIKGKAARERYQPLFVADFWSCQTLQHLIRVCPDPRQLATMAPHELRTAFHEQGFVLGVKTAIEIITYAQKVLLPHPEVVAIRGEILARDLTFLEEVERLIAELEDRLHSLLQQTPYWVWTKVRGLSVTQVASLAAAIGDPSHYTYAAQVFRRSGLVSGRNDSGTRRHKGKGKRVVKTGDVYLRRALMNAVMSLIRHQPTLRDYFNELHRTKHAGVARVATARRAMGILWAMQRDQQSRTLVLKRGAEM